MSDHEQEKAHDVLAAEEFGMPAPDPRLERARDVLAAEEFGMPAVDPALHHRPVTLPDDPTGIAEPHDVLAAEEFALPAGRSAGAGDSTPTGSRRTEALLAAAALALLARRLLHKRRS